MPIARSAASVARYGEGQALMMPHAGHACLPGELAMLKTLTITHWPCQPACAGRVAHTPLFFTLTAGTGAEPQKAVSRGGGIPLPTCLALAPHASHDAYGATLTPAESSRATLTAQHRLARYCKYSRCQCLYSSCFMAMFSSSSEATRSLRPEGAPPSLRYFSVSYTALMEA